MKKAALSLVCLVLAGCGGRVAHPVAITNNYDRQMTCDQLRAERGVNDSKLADLEKERTSDRVNNLGAVLATPLMLPLALDLSSSESTEAEALTKRNAELDRLIAQKCLPAARPSS